MTSYFHHVEQALNDLRQGKMIILTDDPNRENEGDLIFPAEHITPEVMNFMIRHGTGIVCLSLLKAQLKKLALPLMVSSEDNTSARGTPFTLPVDAKEGISTGVSAEDRVRTIQVVMDENTKKEDLVRPGHVYPLFAQEDGVFVRAGHTEGAIDIVRLAGFKSAAVLCEIMNPDGTMAKGGSLEDFAEKYQLTMLSISDLIAYRYATENLILEEVSAELPLEKYGLFKLSIVKEKITHKEHMILYKENQDLKKPMLVRLHSSCATGDLFGSLRCDCRKQLDYSLDRLNQEGGMLIYLNQEGRGIGLFNKIKAYALQETGLDTVEANEKLGLSADLRSYSIAANILRNKNINHIRLLTNNPSKIKEMKKYGINTIEMEPIPIFSNKYNEDYLRTKKEKLDHYINIEDPFKK